MRGRFQSPLVKTQCRKLLIASVLRTIGIVFGMAESHNGSLNGTPSLFALAAPPLRAHPFWCETCFSSAALKSGFHDQSKPTSQRHNQEC